MNFEKSLIDITKEKFGNIITESGKIDNIEFICVKKENIKNIISFVKENGFEFLMDLFAVDYLGYHNRSDKSRFEVIYNLYSFSKNIRFIVKAQISEEQPYIDSITEFFDAANWYEREVYDMFGILFKGHPDMRRILMYDEFDGYPLRKDYPFNKKQPRIQMREG